MRKLLATTIAAGMLLIPAAAWADTIQAKFNDAQLLKIVQDLGYGKAEIRKKGHVQFLFEGSKINLLTYDDGDLQLHYGISGGKWSIPTINRWNKDKRLTRAYIDDDGDPNIESDLLMENGASSEQVTAFIKTFVTAKRHFMRYLEENEDK